MAERRLRNGEALLLAELPVIEAPELVRSADRAVGQGARLAALFVVDGEAPELFALLADDDDGELRWLRAAVAERRYPSLTATLPSAQAFEREIFEETGIVPEGHPWLKPLRRHADLEGDPGGAHAFFAVMGTGVHEVAVGPVHAGIIEPGHFRFHGHGEEVLSLEIQLGYQHRGAEAMLSRARPARRVAIAESIAGDTVIGHATAHAMAIEALGGAAAPLRAEAIRAVALELERLANHIGDLAGLSTDVAFVTGAAHLGRIRGEFLNLLAEISGNRYGRGLVRPGGVRFDLTLERAEGVRDRVRHAAAEAQAAVDLVLRSPTVESRFEKAGIVSPAVAAELGLVGPVARASGSRRDVRHDHAHGLYRYAHIPVATLETGDVMARATVRWQEAERSLDFLAEELGRLPAGTVQRDPGPLRPTHLAAALVEGWRGEIVHVAVTDERGEIRRYKIVDPSFHNWFGLAIALRGNQISDFPLCNKSFNLSYAGHDL